MLFPTLGPSSLLVVVAQQPDEGMQTEQLLCWSGMTGTEHSTISGSNEVRYLDQETAKWPFWS